MKSVIPVYPDREGLPSGTEPGGSLSCGEGPVPAERLRVAAITPFTSIDFPGRLSAVAFLQGCPWRCVYCHNPWMQPREFSPTLRHSSFEELAGLLKRRVGLLDGVVFSGGEPCVDPALGAAMRFVRSLGMEVGLHTSGASPRHLAEVIGLVDWVGLDVKAPPENDGLFDRVTGRKRSSAAFRECFDIIAEAGVRYEARTTAHPDLLTQDDILDIAGWLKVRGTRTFALQIFRPAPEVDIPLSRVGADYPGDDVEKALQDAFEKFTLRRS